MILFVLSINTYESFLAKMDLTGMLRSQEKKEPLNPCLGWSLKTTVRNGGIVASNGTKVKKKKSEKLEKPARVGLQVQTRDR